MKTTEDERYGFFEENPNEMNYDLFDEKRMGERIRKERLKKQMSQEELCDKAVLSRSYLSQIERGERSMTIDYANRIAIGLDMKPAELFLAETGSYEPKEDKSLGNRKERIREMLSVFAKHDNKEVAVIHAVVLQMDRFFNELK